MVCSFRAVYFIFLYLYTYPRATLKWVVITFDLVLCNVVHNPKREVLSPNTLGQELNPSKGY
jgi:hypothetical protein